MRILLYNPDNGVCTHSCRIFGYFSSRHWLASGGHGKSLTDRRHCRSPWMKKVSRATYVMKISDSSV